MPGASVPLTETEITERLAGVPGWQRVGDQITRTFGIRYHGGVALIVHVADTERLIGHHAHIGLRWDTIRFIVTTHDAGHRLTEADFDLATRIDTIAQAHNAQPHTPDGTCRAQARLDEWSPAGEHGNEPARARRPLPLASPTPPQRKRPPPAPSHHPHQQATL